MPSLITLLATVPTVLYVLLSSVPASYKDPYAWVDPVTLNSPAADGRPRTWFNMGYWEGTEDFSEAAEQVARKLLEFADAPEGGSVLDVAHGSGESLLLHLAASPPRSRLDGLAALRTDTARARELVYQYKMNNTATTPVEFYIGTAMPKLANAGDHLHPLNHMAGFLGQPGGSSGRRHDEHQDEQDGESDNQDDAQRAASAPPTFQRQKSSYNLIYVLDAIYHFPPSLGAFLSVAQKSLAPGGVIAYTDILPPPSGLDPITARLISMAFGVPLPNLTSRPSTLDAYKAEVEALGFEAVVVEDWSEQVWPGFGKHMRERGGAWAYVGRSVDWAARTGWRSVAVRAERAGQQDSRTRWIS